jgi:type IV pilus assembly protein PilQ
MRIMWRGYGLAALMAAGLLWTNGTLSANDAPVVHVKAVVKDGGVRLEAQANGPFECTTFRPSASLYVLDLSGVSAADPTGDRVVSSDLVKGYRETTYSAGDKSIVRLEVLLNQGLEPRLERSDSQDLTLLISRAGNDGVAPSASLKPIAAKSLDAPAVAPTGIQAIQQVTLSQAGETTEVNVLGSGPLNYHASRLQNPDRLVLDFESSHLKTPTKHIASNLDPVREIRLAQFSAEVSRVVIDLRTPARYNISVKGNDVSVAFAPTAGSVKAAPTETPANLVTTQAEAPKPTTNPANVAVEAPIPTPADTLPAAFTQNAQALASQISANQQQEAAAATQLASQAAATSSSTAPAMPSAPTASPAAPAQDQAATTTAPATPVPTATAPAAPAMAAPSPRTTESQAPAPAASRYSGEPISVNLKDVDLRDFFRLIHEISGLNVVVDPAVKGTLTIVLDDVPWDQALDIVLHNNDLDKQLDGNVLRIATKETLKKEAEQTRDLVKAQAEAADVVTTTRVLSYAKATDMATVLKKFLSSRGDILADARSNTIIIRDVPSVLPVMDNLLRQLDRKSRQVEIEARVVAANRSFDREIGAIIGFGGGKGNNLFGGTTTVGQSESSLLPTPPLHVGNSGSTTTGAQVPLLTNLGASAPTSGLQYIWNAGGLALDAVINALEEKGVGKLLSKPKIITQNNEKATVKQGTKIPVQTIVNNTVSVQFVDAVLELDVTPQITAEGTIYMDVTVENDQIDQSIPRVQGIPAIDTQAAQTRVTVNDGATVVVGGIIVSSQRTDIQQVPVLGSVPVIGNLFKHQTVSSTAQELLFFLTPRVLPN